MKKSGATGRWEVSAYLWMPNQVIVNQGDEVTMEFVGINGATHTTVIKGYDKAFVVRRGQTTKVTLKADKAGVFPIECASHQPSMVGELVVLPRRQRPGGTSGFRGPALSRMGFYAVCPGRRRASRWSD